MGCAPWVDKVHWDFWASCFFLIPSLFTLIQCFLDPNIVVWSWLNVLRGSGMTDDDFAALCNKISASLYIFDGLLGLIGRYSYRRQVDPADRLLIYEVWRARGVFELDWAA